MTNCLTPVQTVNGQGSCRDCEPCLKRARNLLIGRMAGEMVTAAQTLLVTLTFDQEHVADGYALPADMLKSYFGTMRKRYSLRHFTVGEFGEKNGRPHFHSLLFFQNGSALPDFPLKVRCRNYGWNKGASQYEALRSGVGSAAYLLKYLDKGGKKFRPSPGLGRAYLCNYARMMARNKRSIMGPYGIEFTVPGATLNKGADRELGSVDSSPLGRRAVKGDPWIYRLPPSHAYSTLMVENYIEAYIQRWGVEPDYSGFDRVNFDGDCLCSELE